MYINREREKLKFTVLPIKVKCKWKILGNQKVLSLRELIHMQHRNKELVKKSTEDKVCHKKEKLRGSNYLLQEFQREKIKKPSDSLRNKIKLENLRL